MFDDFKVANYPNVLVSPEMYARHLAFMYDGDVINGFTVGPGTGLQVVLQPGNALIRYGSYSSESARIASLVGATFTQAVATADASNPRIDRLVLYVDNSVNLPAAPGVANLDGPGVVKVALVKGTPAATPAVPNATAIQAAVGAGNPYIPIADIRVNAGVTVIAANVITDRRSIAKLSLANVPLIPASNIDLTTFKNDSNFDSGWKTLPLSNGYSAQNGTTVSYRKIAGVVYLRGQVGKSALDTSVLGTLPADFRPTQVYAYTGASVGANTGKIAVNNVGQINISGIPGGGATYITLDSVNFPV